VSRFRNILSGFVLFCVVCIGFCMFLDDVKTKYAGKSLQTVSVEKPEFAARHLSSISRAANLKKGGRDGD